MSSVGSVTTKEKFESGSNEAADSRDIAIEKYKRLLNLAKTNIKENQKKIEDRDALIEQLRTELLESQNYKKIQESSEAEPLFALRRVDQENIIWILFEYDDDDEDNDEPVYKWKKFDTEESMTEFCSRPGYEPIVIPSKCLSPEECQVIKEACEAKVVQIREDFRKYRVKMELAKQQSDAENRIKSRTQSLSVSDNSNVDSTRIDELMDEVQRLQVDLAEQDQRWQTAYDKQVRETEKLRRAGSEVELASQWRQRYEQVSREKDEIIAKFEMNQNLGRHLHPNHKTVHSKQNQHSNNQFENQYFRAGSVTSDQQMGTYEAKTQYLRNLLLQYLSTDDAVSRKQMETAMSLVLEFTPAEEAEIKNRKQKNDVNNGNTWLSGILGK